MEFEPHREPGNEMLEQTQLPTNAFGQLRFTDWAIGVVDDDSLARDCAHALEEEGIAAQDICIVPGATALQQLRTTQQVTQTEPMLEHVRDAIRVAMREVEPVRDALETEARAGHIFVGIHLPDSNQVDDIRNTLEEHHIHTLYLFEPTRISRLS